MRKAASVLMAACLAFCMTPAAALAAEGAISADGTASSTVRVTAVGKFACVQKSVPPQSMTIKDTKGGNVNDAASPGVLWAQFDYGKHLGDAQGNYYNAQWSWTQESVNDKGQTVTTKGAFPKSGFQRVTVSGNAASCANPKAALVLDDMFKEAGITNDGDRVGTYKVTLTLAGADNDEASTDFAFTVVSDGSMIGELTDNGVTVKGAFSSDAVLTATNLQTAEGAAAQAAYTRLLQEAKGNAVDSAYQLDITSGGLFYEPDPSRAQDSVVVPVSNDLLAATTDNPNRDIMVIGLVDGKIETRTYAGVGGVYTNKADGTDTLTIDSAAKTLEFKTRFPGENIGAFAVAYVPAPKSPDDPKPAQYTVTVSSEGAGSVTPESGKTYAQGAAPTYTFHPGDGYEIGAVSVTSGGTSYTKFTRPASDSLKFDGLDADVEISVTFTKVQQVPNTVRTLTVKQTNAAADTAITALYTKLASGVKSEATAKSFPIADVADGTSPKLTISAGVERTIKQAWLYPTSGGSKSDATKVTVSGTTYMVPGMSADMTFEIEYETATYNPPVVNHTVRGIVQPDATMGEFSGWTPTSNSGEYTVEVAEPNFQTVKVVAATQRNIVIDSVKLYEGKAATGTPKEVLYQSKTGDTLGEFSYTIPAVTGDLTVVATFRQSSEKPPVVIEPDVPTYVINASVSGQGGTISPSGTQVLTAKDDKRIDQTFTLLPASGYELDKVTVNGEEVGTTKHTDGYSFFTLLDIKSNMTVVAAFKQKSGGGGGVVTVPPKVSFKVEGPGSVFPNTTTEVAKGESLTVTFKPNNANCELKSVARDGQDISSQVSAAGVYVLENVQADTTIAAVFGTKSGSTDPGDEGSGTQIPVKPGEGQHINKIELYGHTIEFIYTGDTLNYMVVDQDKDTERRFPATGNTATAQDKTDAIDYFNKLIAKDQGLIKDPDNPDPGDKPVPPYVEPAPDPDNPGGDNPDPGDDGPGYIITIPDDPKDPTDPNPDNPKDPGLDVDVTDPKPSDPDDPNPPKPPVYQWNVNVEKKTENGGDGTIVAQRNGEAVSTTGAIAMNNNGTITVTATPATGCKVSFAVSPAASFTEDSAANLQAEVPVGHAVTPVSKAYTVKGNGTITATFAKEQTVDPIEPDVPQESYTVKAQAGYGGSISPSGTQVVRAGSSQIYTIIPKANYDVNQVTVNNSRVGVSAVKDAGGNPLGYYILTLPSVSFDMNIKATFKKSPGVKPEVTTVPVTVSTKGYGKAYPAGTTKVVPGKPFTVTLEPAEGCSLKSLTMTRNGHESDITSQVRDGAYTLGSVNSAVSFVATFQNSKGETEVKPGEGSGDVDIDVDIDVEVKVETQTGRSGAARAARNIGASLDNTSGVVALDDAAAQADEPEYEVGGEVSPMSMTLKPGTSQKFIIKPYDGSYLSGKVYLVIGDEQNEVTVQEIPLKGGAQPSEEGVNKPYSYVEITHDMVAGKGNKVSLRVSFDDCMNDPENTEGDFYIYEQAAGDSVVNTGPNTSGGVEVETPGGDETIAGDTGTVIVRPPSDTKPIDHIEMLDHTLDFEFDKDGNINKVIIDKGKHPGEQIIVINPAGDEKQIEDAIDKFNDVIEKELGYNPPRQDRPDYVDPGTGDDGKPDGSYEITVPTENKDGDTVEPGLDVGAGTGNNPGQGVLYQYAVNVNVEGNQNGTVKVIRNGSEWTDSFAGIPMNYEGELVVKATPNSGYKVEFEVEEEEEGTITSSEQTAMVASLRSAMDEVSALADGDETAGPRTQSYVVRGNGTVKAKFVKTGADNPDNPDDPNNPDNPDNPDNPNNPDNPGNNGNGNGNNNGGSVVGPGDVAAGTAFVVYASSEGQGTISPSGTLYYKAGATPEFNLNPKTGYSVTAVIVNGERQSWTSSKFWLRDCKVGQSYTVVAEFSATLPAAGTVNAGTRVVRTLQGLAATGDLNAPIMLAIAAAACGALGAAIISSGRRRRQEATSAEDK